VVKYVPDPRLDSIVPAPLRARVTAAADSISSGTLLAAPRPASMEAFIRHLAPKALSRIGT